MFKQSLLAAALLIAGGSVANAAEIGVRHQYGTSWSNVYNGTRVFESDTQSATASDYRAGAVTVSASGPAAFAGAAGYIETIGAAVLDLDVLTLGADALAGTGPLTQQGDADGPAGPTIGSGGSSAPSDDAEAGLDDPAVYATVTASVRREASFAQGRSMTNESSNFDSGSFSTFSSLSTFAQ